MKKNMSPDELIIKQKVDLHMAKIYGMDAWTKKTVTTPEQCEQLSVMLKTYKGPVAEEMVTKLKESWIEGYQLDMKSKQVPYAYNLQHLQTFDIEGVNFH